MDIKLNVPYYRQTYFGSCGPACLLMVMRYWNKKMPFSEAAEVKIWKKSILFPLRMTSPFGLAAAAEDYGFNALIFKEKRNFVLPKIGNAIKYCENLEGSINLERVGQITYEDDFERILNSKKIHITISKVTIDKIAKALNIYAPMIIMVGDNDAARHHEIAPHWVVVEGFQNKEYILIQDAYNKNRKKIPIDLFDRIINIGDAEKDSQALIVYPVNKEGIIKNTFLQDKREGEYKNKKV